MNNKINTKIKPYLFFIVGSFLYCFGTNVFVLPMNLYSGGFVGFSQLISNIFFANSTINIRGIIYFLLNVPLFLIGFKVIGKNFIEKSLTIIILQSIFFSIIPIPKNIVTQDIFVCCILSGIINGTGLVMILNDFGSSGGTDIIGLILSKKFEKLSVGKVSLIANILLYTLCGFLYSIETAIYSLIVSFVTSYTIDKLHSHNNIVSVYILTNDAEKISNIIINEINRDATITNVVGAYSKNDMKLVIAVLSKYDFHEAKKKIIEVDKNAFIFIHNNIEVLGNFEKRLYESRIN